MNTPFVSEAPQLKREELDTGGLERLLSSAIRPDHERGMRLPKSPIVAKVVSLGPSGLAMIDFAGNPNGEPFPARSTCAITSEHVGSDAVVLFENNEPSK